MGRVLHILHLDADPGFRRKVKAVFQENGPSVQLVGAGRREELRAALDQESFDLVLADCAQTQMTSLELLAEARQRPDLAGLVLVSSSLESEGLLKALRDERVDFVPRQIPERLPAVVRRIAQQAPKPAEASSRNASYPQLQLQSKALEAAADAIIITNLNGRIDWANRAFSELTGYLPQEIIGTTADPLGTSRRHTGFYKDVWAPLLAGQTWRAEIVNRRKDGTAYTEENTITPIRDERGKVSHFVTIKRDVTRHDRLQNQLLRSEELNNRLIQTANVIFLQCDSQGRVENLNPAAEQITGYTLAELKGQSWFHTVVPLTRYPQAWEKFQRLVRSGFQPDTFEQPILTKSGKERFILWSHSVLRCGHAVVSALAFGMDITERKAFETELENNQCLLRAILDNIPDPAWLKDREGRFLAGNKSLEHFYRRQLKEILGKTVAQLAHPEAQRFAREDEQVIRGGELLRLEEQVADREGLTRWFDTFKSPIRDNRGQITGTVGIARDITIRKKTQQQLKDSQLRFQLLFETLQEGVAICEILYDGPHRRPVDYRVAHVNPAFQQQTGMALESARGQCITRLFPNQPPPHLDIFERVARTGQPQSFETYFPPLARHFFVSATCFKPGWFVTVFTDITQRKRAQEQLEASEHRARMLFEYAPDAYFLYNLHGEFIDGNKAAEAMIGYPRQELLGKNFLQLHLLDQEGLLRAAASLAETAEGKPNPPREFKLRRKDGTHLLAEIRSYPVRLDGGALVLAIARDITPQKQAEAEREMAEQALRQKQQDLAEAQRLAKLGSWSVDLATDTVTWSDELYRIFGLEKPAFAGNYAAFLQRVHPQDVERTKATGQEARARGGAFQLDYRIITPNGEVKTLHERGYTIKDPGQRVIGMFGTAQDITEQKRIEEQLLASQSRLHALAARIQEIREDERTGIARELHDELGQSLTSFKLDLAWLQQQQPPGSEAAQRVGTILQTTDTLMQTVQRISSNLRPGLLDNLGLIAALEWQADQFQKKTGIRCELVLPQKEVELDRARATAMFRVFQELLTNIARHAQATRADVSLLVSEAELLLEVRDNGRGITQEQLNSPLSLGLLGMKERVLPFCGAFNLLGVPHKGTIAIVRIALERSASSRPQPARPESTHENPPG